MENSSFVKHQGFQSSNIKRLWYSDQKQELIVEYLNGTQYRYSNITNEQWSQLIQSDSKGKFINESIKSKPFQKMMLTD